MKINTLELENFRNHEKTVMELEKINVITGKNNSGKTTIKGALQFGLTGENEWAKTTKDTKALIKTGEKGASVIIDVVGLGKIERRITPSKNYIKLNNTPIPTKQLVKEYNELFNLNVEPISYVIDNNKFFDLSANEQKDLIFKMLGVDLASKTIMKFMDNPTKEAINKIRGKLPETLEIKDFDNIYKDLFGERKLLKKEKESLNIKLDSLKDISNKCPLDIKKFNEDIMRLNNSKGLILETIANAKAREENLKTLKKYLANTLEQIKNKTKLLTIGTKNVKMIENKIDKLLQQKISLEKDLIKNKTTHDISSKQNISLTKMINKLKTNICPLSSKLVCQTDKSSLRSELQNSINENNVAIKDSQSNIIKTEKEIKVLEINVNSLKTQFNIFNELTNLTNQKEQYKADIDKIKISNNSIEKETTKLIETNKEIEKHIVLKSQYSDWIKKQREKNDIEIKVEKKNKEIKILDYLIVEFSPKGVKSRILKKVIGPIEEQCNENLQILTDGQYCLKFDFSIDFEIIINKNDNLVPIKFLSDSEKLRISVIIQDAINKITGINILIVDNVEILDEENEELFISLINQIQDQYENIFIISTNNIKIPNCKTFVISEGCIKENF